MVHRLPLVDHAGGVQYIGKYEKKIYHHPHGYISHPAGRKDHCVINVKSGLTLRHLSCYTDSQCPGGSYSKGSLKQASLSVKLWGGIKAL